MLRRGLSNRPTGAAALLLVGTAYLLNIASTRDHQNLLLTTLFGTQIKDAFIVVQKTGAAVDRVILAWGKMLENESSSLGCVKKNRIIAQRSHTLKRPIFKSYNFNFRPETKAPFSAICPRQHLKTVVPKTI